MATALLGCEKRAVVVLIMGAASTCQDLSDKKVNDQKADMKTASQSAPAKTGPAHRACMNQTGTRRRECSGGNAMAVVRTRFSQHCSIIRNTLPL